MDAVTIAASEGASDLSSIGSVQINHVSRVSDFTVTHQGRIGPVTVNSADGPLLLVRGTIKLGNNLLAQQAPARGIGAIVFNRLALVDKDVVIHTRANVPITDTLGGVSLLADAASPLIITGVLTYIAHSQPVTRPIEFVNLKSIQEVAGPTYASAYQMGTMYGPVILNGKQIHLIPGGAYNTATKAGDPDCLNHCKGRGTAFPGNASCTITVRC